MVGLNGLEPSTSRLSGVRSNQLSYRPKWIILSMKEINLSKLNITVWEPEIKRIVLCRMFPTEFVSTH